MRFLLIIILLVPAEPPQAQETDHQQSQKEAYLQKSKSKKRTSNILLVSGLTLITGGLIFMNSVEKGNLDGLAGLAAAGLGLTLLVGSGMAFNSSKKFKRKASQVSFQMEHYSGPSPQGLVRSSYPSVQLIIPLQRGKNVSR